MKSVPLVLELRPLPPSPSKPVPPSSLKNIRPLQVRSTLQPFFNPLKPHSFLLKSQRLPHPINLPPRGKFLFSASASNTNNNNDGGDASGDQLNGNRGIEENGPETGGEEEKGNGNGRPRLDLKWVDLLLDPDPDNVVAVGLTGVLAWASVQVLWQLFVISVAILLAALKYSFVAALLIFILIALL